MPADERSKLEAIDISKTTAEGDFHRAFRCAEWAVEIAPAEDQRTHHHIFDRMKEALQVLRDTEYGVSFGVMMGDERRASERLKRDPRYRDKSIGVNEDIKVSWVDGAITIATDSAEVSGWSSVPWEELIRRLVAVRAA